MFSHSVSSGTTLDRSQIPAPLHQPGDVVHGFIIDAVTEIPDIRALAYEATHKRTGAKVLHVHCNDEENLFSVGFRTPPSDSTGVAHILEHSVLAGSQQFPVKDAFNELGKRTLNTFLNAMTWPDRTVYPTCSAVRQDYFNLATVYLDLVFHPLLRPETFKQEGHHLEFETPDDPTTPLTVGGIVYNEMKGAYSSEENLIGRTIQQHLFPDTCYGVDSGGDPQVIPDLTYEQFCNFHRRFYSASNARFMFYGDVPLSDNLAFIGKALEPFERLEVDSRINLQPRWSEPKSVEIHYPVGKDDSLDKKTFVVLNWMANESADTMTSLLMDIACYAIYGNAAAPLRRALIDSGLGQDVFPSAAYDADIRQAIVSFGLRGTNPEQASTIEALILDTLQKLVHEGLDKQLIEASFHQIEFGGKEITGVFPVMLLMRVNPSWYFGGDPKAGLRFATLVEQARNRYEQEPRLFETLIKRWILDNPHRLRVTAVPSHTVAEDAATRFKNKMAARKAQLQAAQLEQIKTEALALKKLQDEAERPENIATLPKLRAEDIPRRVRVIPTEKRIAHGVTVMEHPTFANGIGYVGLSFDIRDLEDELAIYLPFAGRATAGLGAAGLSYSQMTTRIAQKTGGISLAPMVGRHVVTGERFDRWVVDGKVLKRNAAELFAILRDLLLKSDTTDHKRLKDLVREMASRASANLVPAGSQYAVMRAAASLSPTYWRGEQWGGVTQVKHLKALAKSADQVAEDLAQKISGLQKRMFTRSRVMAHVCGDPDTLATIRPLLDEFLAWLPVGEPVKPVASKVPPLSMATGVVLQAEVNYVAQVLQLVNLMDKAAPALDLLAEIASNDYLYKKLRVQGGAYGGRAAYDASSGLFRMLSYRDPKLVETFDVFQQLADFIKRELTDDLVDASRVGAIGAFEGVLSPAGKLSISRSRHLLGITDEARMAYREGLFTVKAADIRATVLPLVEQALATAPRAVLGSRPNLEKANAAMASKLELVTLE